MLFNNEFIHYALLYTGNDIVKNTFRVELRMKDSVDKAALTYAVNTAIKRYPYFAVETADTGKEIETVFNERPVTVTEGKRTPCLCTEEANRHFLAVAFSGKRIFIDVHHGLTDGIGIERFAKTMVYYYVGRKYSVNVNPEGIYTTDTPVSEDEYKDPFSKAESIPENPFSVYKAEPAFDLGTVNPSADKKTVFYLKINEKDLMSIARSNDGTPNALFSALLYRAVLKHHPHPEQPVVGGVAITTRTAYNAPLSAASLIGITHIKYTEKAKDYSLEKLGTMGRGAIMLQSDDQNVLAGTKGKYQLLGYLKTMPDHRQRNMTYMGLIQRTTALDTYSVSYIGKRDWSCFSDYVDAYYTIAEPKKGGIILEINTHNGWFDICITQDFESDRYVNTLMEMLEENNVEYLFEGSEKTDLPEQKVF